MNLTFQHRDEFPKWLAEHKPNGIGVEVGVYTGLYSEVLLNGWNGKLFGVDPYRFQDQKIYDDPINQPGHIHEAKGHAFHRLDKFGERFALLEIESIHASCIFAPGSLDFIYLDGNHSFEATLEDCATWYSKIKPDGILAGHDYGYNPDYSWCNGVKPAVIKFLTSIRRTEADLHLTSCSSWWLMKNQR